jgi:hypothetical protein
MSKHRIMSTSRNLLLLLLSIGLLASTAGCARRGCTNVASPRFDPSAQKDDGSCGDVVQEYRLTQAELDRALTAQILNLNGSTFAGVKTIPHILTRPEIRSTDSTYRSVFVSSPARLTSADQVRQGTIIVKRVYLADPITGLKGTRANTYLMIKQYPGYYPEGGDYQYVGISYNPATDFTANPNAIYSQAVLNGKIATCANCHLAAPGNRFLYTQN